MHLSIPFAAPGSDAGRAALQALRTPRLDALLARLDADGRDESEDTSLSPPHERVRARARGWAVADGALPWAALRAAEAGLAIEGRAWGWITPVHLLLGTEQVSLMHPDALALDEAASRALFDAANELFAGDGWALHWLAPTEWLGSHPMLAGLATASLDRVIGRHIDRWLPDAAAARGLRRLQSEVQMLWYRHPANEAREAAGQLPVNSFWVSGCGVAQAGAAPAGWHETALLRAAALGEDWAAWAEAWAAVEAGPLAEAEAALERGGPLALTLCGERHAATFVARPRRWWQRLGARWQAPRAADVLGAL